MKSKYIFIISSMRSGSTLLKALLATRNDIMHFPEMPFNRATEISSEKPMILIKCPAYYGKFDYPELPNIISKKIVLLEIPMIQLFRCNI